MAFNANTSEMCESATRQEIDSEIKELATAIGRIYDLFLTVSKKLEKIDRKGVFEVPYAPKWRALFTQYKELVLQSQENASAVRVLFDAVLTHIANHQNDHQALSTNLARYIQDLDNWAKTAKSIDLDYTSLYDDVNIFKSNLEEHIKDEINETSEESASELEDIDNKIGAIKEILSKRRVFPDIFRKILSLEKEKKPRPGPFIGPSVICALAPEAASKYLPSSLQPADTSGSNGQKQRAALKRDLEELQNRKKLLTSKMVVRMKALEEARVIIEKDLCPIFDEILGRLSIVAHVWHVLYMDVNSLRTIISNSDAQFALKDNRSSLVEHFKNIYTALSFSIDAFVSVTPFGNSEKLDADPHAFVSKLTNLVLGNPSEGTQDKQAAGVNTDISGLTSVDRVTSDTGIRGALRDGIAATAVLGVSLGLATRHGNVGTQDGIDSARSISNTPNGTMSTASITTPPLAPLPHTGDRGGGATRIALGAPHAVAAAVNPSVARRGDAITQDAIDEARSNIPVTVVPMRQDVGRRPGGRF